MSKSGVDVLVRKRHLPVLPDGAIASDGTGSYEKPAQNAEDVQTAASYMRCHAFNATFRASMCLARQAQAAQPASGRERLFGRPEFARCRTCEQGQGVAATIKARERIAKRYR